ncbi:hypothetical protein D3C75_681680 [compost metagenome]
MDFAIPVIRIARANIAFPVAVPDPAPDMPRYMPGNGNSLMYTLRHCRFDGIYQPALKAQCRQNPVQCACLVPAIAHSSLKSSGREIKRIGIGICHARTNQSLGKLNELHPLQTGAAAHLNSFLQLHPASPVPHLLLQTIIHSICHKQGDIRHEKQKKTAEGGSVKLHLYSVKFL